MFGGGKVILAPMVRIGTLPMRLLAKRHGADFCFTPEVIDIKLSKCERVVSGDLVDFIFDKKELVLRVHRSERPHLILQIGSSNPETALKAALLLREDVCGVDLNCGCPKRFSTHGGMGSALLRTPQLLCDILETLCRKQALPVSCKIRCLPDVHDTVALVTRIVKTGIHSLTVHCRTPQQRYDTPADWSILPTIHPIASEHNVNLVVNGDIQGRPDLSKFGGLSVMVARAAQHNASCFSDTLLPIYKVHRQYLELAVEFDNSLSNTKYCLLQSLADIPQKSEDVKDLMRKLYVSKSYEDVYKAYMFPLPTKLHSTLQSVNCISHGEDVENGYTAEQQDKRVFERHIRDIL